MSRDSGLAVALPGCVESEVLVELAQAVWASFVDPEVLLVDLGPWVPEPDEAGVVVGSVAIHGPTPAVLSVCLPALAASDAAARMFDIELAAVAPADVRDAAGELANMIGGNVKSMLPGEHRLGLPTVTTGAAGPDLDEALASAALLWGEHTLLVTVDRPPGGSSS